MAFYLLYLRLGTHVAAVDLSTSRDSVLNWLRPYCLKKSKDTNASLPKGGKGEEMQTESELARSERFARCIANSKRVRWDIETDVIRGRSFDISHKFLPDGLSQVD